jgi:hypothetical protein
MTVLSSEDYCENAVRYCISYAKSTWCLECDIYSLNTSFKLSLPREGVPWQMIGVSQGCHQKTPVQRLPLWVRFLGNSVIPCLNYPRTRPIVGRVCVETVHLCLRVGVALVHQREWVNLMSLWAAYGVMEGLWGLCPGRIKINFFLCIQHTLDSSLWILEVWQLSYIH